jgi:MFS family permease
VIANLSAGVGATLLLASGNLVVALTYTVVAGASLGAISTLQGIYTHELVDTRHLGMLMGAQQAVFGIGGAIGPILAGALIDATGSYTAVLLVTAACFIAAGATLFRPAAAMGCQTPLAVGPGCCPLPPSGS